MTARTHPQLEWTDTADSAVFAAFFDAYQRAFILPDEMEDRDGFARCLSLNHGTAQAGLAARYGAFRELCVIGRDPASGAPVGGANFIAMPQRGADGRQITTANLNYVFVDAAARGRGWFRPLVTGLRELIGGLFSPPGAAAVLVFIEQNDPLLLTPEAYARDSQYSGIDQFDRLRIWSRQDARILDFAYVQPPLSARQEADAGLIYSVLGVSGPSLDAGFLRQHLRAFFGISVLKGRALEGVAARQLDELEAMQRAGRSIKLLDPGPALAALDRTREAELVRTERRPLRDWLKDQSPASIVL